jgi:hypothetical protein
VIDLALGGRPIATVYEGDRRFDLVARYAAESRGDPGRIGQLLIPTPDGARIPLAQLSAIRMADGATIIARRDGQRAMTVRTNIRGRDQGGFVAEAQARFAEAVTLPAGYTVTWGGQYWDAGRECERRHRSIRLLNVDVNGDLNVEAFAESRIDRAPVIECYHREIRRRIEQRRQQGLPVPDDINLAPSVEIE